jgi:hypothetical protein
MKAKLLATALFASVLAICLPVWAHHGNAAYDMKNVEMKSATITKFLWANPHCIVLFDYKREDGKVEHWTAELGSPSAISLVGFTKTSLQPGDIVTMHVTVSKTGNPVGRIRRIVLADGSTLPHPGTGGADGDDAGDGGGRGGRSGAAY